MPSAPRDQPRHVDATLPPGVTTRPAGRADAEPIAELIIDSFESYRSFAEPGWEPPPVEQELAAVRTTLEHPEAWSVVAEIDGRLIGQCSFLPAAASREPSDEPGLAHLRTLFVAEDWWGTGLAQALHDAARREARDRGYRAMRLVTPAGQQRARRFYERAGWHQDGPERPEPALGLDIVGYRVEL